MVEDVEPLVFTWQTNLNDAVKATWTVGNGWVYLVGVVGGCKGNDAMIWDNTVHRLQELTQQRMVGSTTVKGASSINILDDEESW